MYWSIETQSPGSVASRFKIMSRSSSLNSSEEPAPDVSVLRVGRPHTKEVQRQRSCVLFGGVELRSHLSSRSVSSLRRGLESTGNCSVQASSAIGAAPSVLPTDFDLFHPPRSSDRTARPVKRTN